MTKPTVEQRLWAKVEKTATCWLFRGTLNNKGYGKLFFEGRLVYAHRVSYALAHGGLPASHVLHRCDTPACVNPDHLFLGTQGDNIRDMAAKGRHWQLRKTQCPQGHPYTPENTKLLRNGRTRQCITCWRAWRPKKATA